MKLTINVPSVPDKAQLQSAMISIIETNMCAENIVFLQRVISQTIRANVDDPPNCALEEAAQERRKRRSDADVSADDKNKTEVRA